MGCFILYQTQRGDSVLYSNPCSLMFQQEICLVKARIEMVEFSSLSKKGVFQTLKRYPAFHLRLEFVQSLSQDSGMLGPTTSYGCVDQNQMSSSTLIEFTRRQLWLKSIPVC